MYYRPAILLISIFVISGCGSDQYSVDLIPASSSNEALIQTINALDQGNKQALLSIVAGGSNAQAFFASIVESRIVIRDFEAAFLKAYGEQAWIDFQADKLEAEADMQFIVMDYELLRSNAGGWNAGEENGGVFDLGIGLSIPFIERDGGWVIDGANVFSSDNELVSYTETQERLNDFTKSYMKAIGADHISAEDIDYQMGRDLMNQVFGIELNGTSTPNRFDLDDL